MQTQAQSRINPYTYAGLEHEVEPDKIPSLVHAKMNLIRNDNTRKREHVIARQISMSLMYVFSQDSLYEVGRVFNRDHATVLHAMWQMDNAVDIKDPLVMPVMINVFAKLYKSFLNQVAIGNSIDHVDELSTRNMSVKAQNIKHRLLTYKFSRTLTGMKNINQL